MSAKEISAPVDIGNQGSGNINLGSVANGVFLPGLTASKVLLLDGSNKIISGDIPLSDLTPSGTGTIYSDGTNVLTSNGVAGEVWTSNAPFPPSWQPGGGGSGVLNFSAGTTGLTPNIPTAGAIVLGGVLNAVSGGTGQSSYAIGDLLYANTTTTLARLADVAVGSVLLSGGLNIAPGWGQVNLATMATGVLPIANGGTNASTVGAAGTVIYSNGTSYASTAAGTAGQVLTSNGAATPTWTTLSSMGVTSFSAGTTGITPNAPTTGAIVLSGTLIAVNGGTGLSSFAVGDLLFANTTTTLARLADVAVGSVLLSGGLNTAPSWGHVNLASMITGVLPLANGGTGANLTAINGGTLYSTGSSLAISAAGTAGQVWTSNGAAAPTWQAVGGSGVTTVGPNVAGNINSATITGTTINLAVAATTTTGVVYGLMSSTSSNTYSGYQSGTNVNNGTNNSSFGYRSGQSIAAGGADGNTMIGSHAGSTITTGSGNICIGLNSGSPCTTGQSNIYIGYLASASDVGTSNEIVIGPNTTGTGSDTFTVRKSSIQPGTQTNLQINTSTGQVFFAASSQRYKNPLPDPTIGPYVSYLNSLVPRSFTFKNDPSNTPCIGYYAEEVEAIVGPQNNPVFHNLLSFINVDDTSQPPIGTETDINGNQVPVYPQKSVVNSIKYEGFVVPIICYTKWHDARIAAIERQLGITPPTPTN